ASVINACDSSKRREKFGRRPSDIKRHINAGVSSFNSKTNARTPGNIGKTPSYVNATKLIEYAMESTRSRTTAGRSCEPDNAFHLPNLRVFAHGTESNIALS